MSVRCLCGAVVEDAEPEDLKGGRIHNGFHEYYDDCPYVRCDHNDCRAKKDPGTDVVELQRAVDHWQHHAYMSGCSHAR